MPKFFTSVKKYDEKTTDFISRLLGWNPKNTGFHAICGVDIRDIVTKFTQGNQEKGTAILADGGSPRMSHSGGWTRLVKESIANWFSTSRPSSSTVDNLIKPAEGIEPSGRRVTSLVPHQAAGFLPIYHSIARNLFVEINRWGCSFYADVCTSSQQRESWEVLSLTPIERSLNTV